jgi:ribosomal protein S18 acetylase RimI-like enzyme
VLDGDALSIRRATPDDTPEVARFGAVFDGAVLADETRRFLGDPRHHLVLGYVAGHPAGFASAVEVFHPDKRPELFLNEIGVAEGFRRRGMGRMLIDELKAIARDCGCVSIWVLTDEDNPAAMSLYRTSGGQWDGRAQVMFEFAFRDAEGP